MSTQSKGAPPAVDGLDKRAETTEASPAGEATKRTQSSCLDVLFIESCPYYALDTSKISIQVLFFTFLLLPSSFVLTPYNTPQALYERGPLSELMSKLNAEKMLDWIVRVSNSLRFTNRQYALKLAAYFYQRSGFK